MSSAKAEMKRMDTLGKLRVLGAAARHDASCAAGALKSRSGQGKSPAFPGIYISWTDDGRRVPLLKVLYTNRCAYDCAYCANRASADVPRVSFTPRELADLAAALHRRGSIAGLGQVLARGTAHAGRFDHRLLEGPMPKRSPALDHPESLQHSQLFTVRVWREDRGNGGSEWRGKVQHVLSGEARYFRDWATLIAALQEMLKPHEV